MLAYDLFRRPALNPLRPRVPCDDVPLRVEHEDSVVLDVLNKESEPLLALRAVFLVELLSCQVAHDLREPEEGARLVPQGGQHAAAPEKTTVLADVPAVVLSPAQVQGLSDLPLGLATRNVVGGKQPGEVLADHFRL